VQAVAVEFTLQEGFVSTVNSLFSLMRRVLMGVLVRMLMVMVVDYPTVESVSSTDRTILPHTVLTHTNINNSFIIIYKQYTNHDYLERIVTA
jgi:hypothetical protein